MICLWRADQLFAEADDLRDTDKSRYFVITEFNNCFIIRSLSLFFNKYLLLQFLKGQQSDLPLLRERHRKKENLRISKILFAAKKGTTLRMSRQLFVGIYLQVT